MQITVEISEQFAEHAAKLGLTPEAYAGRVLTAIESDNAIEADWIAEADRRATELDAEKTVAVPWENIERKLRERIAS